MRIGIVNDTPMAIEVLQRLVSASKEHQVAWIARDGAEAVAQCAAALPDLVLMDLYMPVMDGVESTRQIMRATPCPILIVTATIDGHRAKVYEALGAGALDVVATPRLGPGDSTAGAAELFAKIDVVRRVVSPAPTRTSRDMPVSVRTWPSPPTTSVLVAIGASAGGPAALATLLGAVPTSFPGAIVVVQHMDVHFSQGLVDWLGAQTQIPVRMAMDGDRPAIGVALIASGGRHLVFNAAEALQYVDEPLALAYRPSVDVFFRSIVDHWRGSVVGVVLTGMGRDGATGLRALRMHGGVTLAQDQETSVVYGMPKAAAEVDPSAEILPLQRMAPRIAELCVSSHSPMKRS